MKKTHIILTTIAIAAMQLLAPSSFAQITSETQKNAEKAIADSVQYVLPTFGTGRITYKDGSFSNGMFNIFSADQTIRFIDEKGQIMNLSNESEVDRVQISGRLFLKEGDMYVGVVDSDGDVLLCVCRKVKFDDSKSGAFGLSSQTTNIQTVGRLDSDPGQRYFMSADVKYEVKNDPYIVRKNILYQPTKGVLKKCFPDHKDEVEAYIENNKLNLSKMNDVQQVFTYGKSL